MMCIWQLCLLHPISQKPEKGGRRVNMSTDARQGQDPLTTSPHSLPALSVAFSFTLMPSSSISHCLPMDHLIRGGGSPPWPAYYITRSLHAGQCFQPASQEKHSIICVANIPWLQSHANALLFFSCVDQFFIINTSLIYGNHTSETSLISQNREGGRKVKQDRIRRQNYHLLAVKL